jgi:hypothetical protein
MTAVSFDSLRVKDEDGSRFQAPILREERIGGDVAYVLCEKAGRNWYCTFVVVYFPHRKEFATYLRNLDCGGYHWGHYFKVAQLHQEAYDAAFAHFCKR